MFRFSTSNKIKQDTFDSFVREHYSILQMVYRLVLKRDSSITFEELCNFAFDQTRWDKNLSNIYKGYNM